jgi:RNA polymerase sigma factor (sigma-70 family)
MLPLARALAGRYAGRGEPLDDLVQVACIGIMKAIEGFDLDRDVRFSSYATPTVLGEIKRHFRDRTVGDARPARHAGAAAEDRQGTRQADLAARPLADLCRSSPTQSTRRSRTCSRRCSRSARGARARWTSRPATIAT